jgi:hypothetical protein
MVKGIYDSRAKDYHNDFRRMVYGSQEEMDKVLGKLGDNSFIHDQQADFAQFKKNVALVSRRFKL